MLKAASAFPDYQLVLAGAPSITPEYYQQYVGDVQVKIIFNQTYRLLQHSDVALVTSGTATLETALFRIPQVVCYYLACEYISLFYRSMDMCTVFCRSSYNSLICCFQIIRMNKIYIGIFRNPFE